MIQDTPMEEARKLIQPFYHAGNQSVDPVSGLSIFGVEVRCNEKYLHAIHRAVADWIRDRQRAGPQSSNSTHNSG